MISRTKLNKQPLLNSQDLTSLFGGKDGLLSLEQRKMKIKMPRVPITPVLRPQECVSGALPHRRGYRPDESKSGRGDIFRLGCRIKKFLSPRSRSARVLLRFLLCTITEE